MPEGGGICLPVQLLLRLHRRSPINLVISRLSASTPDSHRLFSVTPPLAMRRQRAQRAQPASPGLRGQW